MAGAIVDERLGLLGDDRACAAGARVHLDHAIDLMAALIVLERERSAVLAPRELEELIRIREERVIDLNDVFRRDVDEHRISLVEYVAGFGIDALHVLGLQLIRGRRLDVAHEPAVARRHAIHRDLGRVWRPGERLQCVRSTLRTVVGERGACACAGRAQVHVEVLDVRFVLSVRRTAHRTVGGRTRRPLLARQSLRDHLVAERLDVVPPHGPSNGTMSLCSSSAIGPAPPRPPRPPRPPTLTGPTR